MGFLNGNARRLARHTGLVAVLVAPMILTHTGTVEAAPSITLNNSVYDVTEHGDGTQTVTYDLEVASDSTVDVDYELVDELRFGDGISILSTTLTADGITFSETWDGLGDVAVTSGPQTLAAGVTDDYRIAVTVELGDVVTAEAADCTIDGEDGTGLWNSATVSDGSEESIDTACVAVERPDLSVEKSVLDGPTRSDDGIVTVTYALTVTNTGAAVTPYSLVDEFAFGADAVVESVEVVNAQPGNIRVNEQFNGDSDTAITTAAIAPGETHRYEVNVVVTDSGTPTTVEAGFEDDEESSFAIDTMKALGKAAAGKAGGAIAGQMLSAVGLGEGSLSDLSDQLKDLNQTLMKIDEDLKQLDDDLLQQSCNQASQVLQENEAIPSIKTLFRDYQSFLDQVSGDDPVPPDLDDIEQWVDTVLNGNSSTKSMQQSLSDIHGAMTAPPSAQGILLSCLDPGVTKPPTPGLDDVYYAKVSGLTTWYFNYQMEALMMLNEAWSWQAQQSIGPLLGADPTTFNPCAQYWNETQHTKCNFISTWTKGTYEDLAQQYLLAGAPYTSDEVALLYRPGGRLPVLLATSLEDFTNNKGCPTPLTQAYPCGLTVGRQTTAGLNNTFTTTYAGYNIWRPATRLDLADLVQGRSGGQNVGDYMDSIGFRDAGGKVVVFSDTFSWTSPEWQIYNVTTTTFLDTRFPFGIADSSGQMPHYVRNGPDCHGDHEAKPKENDVITDQSNRWYNIHYVCGDWDSNPGYHTVESSLSFAKAYRWPALNPADLTCVDDRSRTNPSGALTRCGTDFNAWFDTQVPRPEVCGGTVFGACTTPDPSALAAAPVYDPSAYDCVVDPGEEGTGLRNTITVTYSQETLMSEVCAETPPIDVVNVKLDGGKSPGEWASPVRDGDVEVTFDDAGVKSVDGLVQLDATVGDGSAIVRFDVRRPRHHWLRTRAISRRTILRACGAWSACWRSRPKSWYVGSIQINDGDSVTNVPMKKAELHVDDDGTVSGTVTVKRGKRGASVLSWSVRDGGS